MEAEKFRALIKEEKPECCRGDELKTPEGMAVIRSIYSRRLEDLTFGDLEMIGYTNPNAFVKDWDSEHGSFDKDKIVWVVVYVGGRE